MNMSNFSAFYQKQALRHENPLSLFLNIWLPGSSINPARSKHIAESENSLRTVSQHDVDNQGLRTDSLLTLMILLLRGKFKSQSRFSDANYRFIDSVRPPQNGWQPYFTGETKECDIGTVSANHKTYLSAGAEL